MAIWPGPISNSLLERVKDVGEGLDQEKAVVKKAAFLLHSLVTHHPFINGNKRTAFEAVEAFLELNGYVLRAKTDEIYSFLSDLGSRKALEMQAEHWIATNLARKRRGSVKNNDSATAEEEGSRES